MEAVEAVEGKKQIVGVVAVAGNKIKKTDFLPTTASTLHNPDKTTLAFLAFIILWILANRPNK